MGEDLNEQRKAGRNGAGRRETVMKENKRTEGKGMKTQERRAEWARLKGTSETSGKLKLRKGTSENELRRRAMERNGNGTDRNRTNWM